MYVVYTTILYITENIDSVLYNHPYVLLLTHIDNVRVGENPNSASKTSY